jgi:hypothetical protein
MDTNEKPLNTFDSIRIELFDFIEIVEKKFGIESN